MSDPGIDPMQETLASPQAGAPALEGQSVEGLDTMAARERIRGSLFGGAHKSVSIGRYMVLGRVGAGGMGEVFAAWDPELDRKVAIKVLHGPDPDDPDAVRSQARLLREAQAMAKLTHPNVVRIYDVGVHAQRLYLAMEFVAGETLRGWVREHKPEWTRIVGAIRSAGRGLAAAHRAGLVHRDFKPDNVMVAPSDEREDSDPRVLVMDFGLALIDPDIDSSRVGGNEPSTPPGLSASLLDDGGRLTQHGVVMGTPAYMAPEQFRGTVDARTDQYALCVAAFELLHGRRPHEAGDLRELYRLKRGARVSPQRNKAVPDYVDRVLIRGLAPEPDERWPTIDALIDALGVDPRVRTRRRLLALAALGGIAAAVALTPRPEAPCEPKENPLEGVWDAPRRQLLSEHLDAAGYLGQSVAPHVLGALDTYAAQWRAAKIAACEATHVHKEQSPELLDRRMACLERRRSELDAVIEVVTSGDQEVVRRAQDALEGLPAVTQCADRQRLLTDRPPVPAKHTDLVEDVEKRLDVVAALQGTAQFESALELAKEIELETREVDYDPLRAEVMLWLGREQQRTGASEEGLETLWKALWQAERAPDDYLALAVRIEMIHVLAAQLGRVDEGRRVGNHAQAWVDRLGLGHDALGAEVMAERAFVAQVAGEYELAIELNVDALALTQELGEPDGHLLHNLANVELALDRYDDAVRYYQLAVDSLSDSRGADHPDTAHTRNGLALVEYGRGNFQRAYELHEEVLAAFRATLGDDHPDVAVPLNGMGNVRERQGRLGEALELHRRGEAVIVSSHGPTHVRVGVSKVNQANVQRQMGDNGDCIRSAREAAEIWTPLFPSDHLLFAHVLSLTGACLVGEGQVDEGRDDLARALEIVGPLEGEHLLRAEVQARLAQASWPDPHRREEAESLARAALESYAKATDARPDEVQAHRTWMKEVGLLP